jgi:subtilase family serine protease
VVNVAGEYRVTYDVSNAGTVSTAVGVVVNGVAVGGTTVAPANGEAVNTVTFAAGPGARIVLENEGSGILSVQPGSSITVDQIG